MMRIPLVALIVPLLLCGCGSSSPEKSAVKVDSYLPDWISSPKRVDAVGDLFGVGVARIKGNRALAIKTAEDRAVAGIARVLEAEVSRIIDGYRPAAPDSAGVAAPDRDIDGARRSLVEEAAAGIEVINRFLDKPEGLVYVRARLELEEFEKRLDGIDTIGPQMKEYIRGNAKKAFAKLEATIERGD